MSARPSEDPDVRLMLRVRDGDQVAFAELVERHGPSLVSFMFRYVGSVSVAEDLAQDCFLKVHRAAERYQPTAKFRTWLFTIATNLCLNQKRWSRKRGHLSLDRGLSDDDGDRAIEIEDDGLDARAQMERDELRSRVREAIATLPPQQRIATVLARFEQLPYTEIAEVMGSSVMAVKSLLNRAKNNLREALSREIDAHEASLEGDAGRRSGG